MNSGEHQRQDGKTDVERLLRRLAKTGDTDQKEEPFDSADLVELIHEMERYQADLEGQNNELQDARQELGELRDLYELAPCGYLNLNDKGEIIRINQAGILLLNDVRNRIQKSSFSRYCTSEYEKIYLQALQQAKQTGEKQCLDLLLVSGRGGKRWVRAEIAADLGGAGELRSYRLMMMDISDKKTVEKALAESEKKYRLLFEDMVCGVLLLDFAGQGVANHAADMRCLEVNSAFERLTGIPRKQAEGAMLADIWPQAVSITWLNAASQAIRSSRPVEIEQPCRKLGKHLHLTFFPMKSGRIGVAVWDVSESKRGRESLNKTCRDLELVIRERSADLLEANLQLEKEIDARSVVQLKVEEKSKALQKADTQKKENDAAMKKLLEVHDKERARLEEIWVCNLNELLRPLLAKLAEGSLSERQKVLLQLIYNAVDEISSPLSRRFILESKRLTPVETQVAGLIRLGKSSKDIAGIMGVAVSTVDYHRLNIRRRLGLKNKSINLQSYLKSLV